MPPVVTYGLYAKLQESVLHDKFFAPASPKNFTNSQKGETYFKGPIVVVVVAMLSYLLHASHPTPKVN